MTVFGTLEPPSAGAAAGPRADDGERLRRLESRLARERLARREAERLLESKSRELYEANRSLSALAADLECRVAERTRELSDERQRALERAECDALTGIANRASFTQRLHEWLVEPQALARGLVVLLLDLDDFKRVNDTLGHAAGDALLREVAGRLSTALRAGHLVARLGGDEFAVIARGVKGPCDTAALAQHVHDLVERPVVIDGRQVPCDCSIGVAEAGGNVADELLRDADLALYASKRAGRGRVTSFDPRMRIEIERRVASDAEIRRAVAEDRILPWYQPVWCVERQRFAGAEMLARWHHENGSVRSPAEFLGSVEAMNLLDPMMENMIRRGLQEVRPCVESGRMEYLSINVSPTQFDQGWAQRRLPALLAEVGFPPHALMVEITETALIHDIARTSAMLRELTATGMRIALDDFGVGYSNFALLRQLAFDVIKIDRTLVQDIEVDERARALTECMLGLAGRLQARAVAEGVETAEQARLLAAAGCSALQGYWFSKPQRGLAFWSD